MDLFGYKAAKRIRDLEEAFDYQKRMYNMATLGWEEANQKIAELETSELRLMGQIREMDQSIYNMGQCSSWTDMRPIFADLLARTMERKQRESDRIAEVLIPEMKKAYHE